MNQDIINHSENTTQDYVNGKININTNVIRDIDQK